MKKLLIMAVAACCLAACNKELGPEYKVAPVISNVSCSPGLDDVHAGDDVRVTATVTSEYGFTGISILRALNDDETKVKEEGAWLSTNKTDTEKRYSGTIGKEKARHESDFPDTCRLCLRRVYVLRGIRIYRAGRDRPGADAQPRSELIYTLYNNMELKEILAISGQPGLYKYVAQSTHGVIVESLLDGRRMNASATSKVSSLTEISMFTEGDDIPLADVFTKIYAHTGGREAVSPKESPEKLKACFAEVLPDYDRDRVHVSDIKKCFAWYNILVKAGFTEFKLPAETE